VSPVPVSFFPPFLFFFAPLPGRVLDKEVLEMMRRMRYSKARRAFLSPSPFFLNPGRSNHGSGAADEMTASQPTQLLPPPLFSSPLVDSFLPPARCERHRAMR